MFDSDEFIEKAAAVQVLLSELGRAMDEALRPVLNKLAGALRTVEERLHELGRTIGLLDEGRPAGLLIWRMRPRTPNVFPARPVDAVAAGRHPAMTMRNRICGGRR